jgi:hypothetical protein
MRREPEIEVHPGMPSMADAFRAETTRGRQRSP